MSIPDHSPWDPSHCEACARMCAELEAKKAMSTLAAIAESLEADGWTNADESTIDAVRSLLVARNELAREVDRLRAELEASK